MSTLKLPFKNQDAWTKTASKSLKTVEFPSNNGNDQLKAEATNFPLEVLYLRNSDIPQYLIDGVVDIAIVGDNLFGRKRKNIKVIQKLGFSKASFRCRSKTFDYKSIKDLEGMRIATSYPNTVIEYFAKFGMTVDIHQISGSVEIAPNIGLADGIVDIVSSGSTLFKNNLKEVEVIFKSEVVLVVSPNSRSQSIIDTLQFRIESVLRARKSKYILMNVPNEKIEEIGKILPVLKSLTVMLLAEEGWSSVHSVIDKDTFWDVIDQLKEAGAEGILVCPIENGTLKF